MQIKGAVKDKENRKMVANDLFISVSGATAVLNQLSAILQESSETENIEQEFLKFTDY